VQHSVHQQGALYISVKQLPGRGHLNEQKASATGRYWPGQSEICPVTGASVALHAATVYQSPPYNVNLTHQAKNAPVSTGMGTACVESEAGSIPTAPHALPYISSQ
jgi:hypothetical protein